MNPYLIIAFLVTILGAGAGGFKLGVDHEVASQAREDEHIAQAVDAATNAAADAIAKLKPKFTTIQNEVQREIQTNTVYTDCKLSPDGLLLANRALSGGLSASKSKLPGTDSVEQSSNGVTPK